MNPFIKAALGTAAIFAVLGGIGLSVYLWDWIGALAWIGPAFVGLVYLGIYLDITKPPQRYMKEVPKCH